MLLLAQGPKEGFNTPMVPTLYSAPLPPKEADGLRIIAVGDSITEGACSSNPALKSWPKQFSDMLGGNNTATYEVINYGLGGRTMMKV